jgi:drug/metabolite transporter (DMT)-like permease
VDKDALIDTQKPETLDSSINTQQQRDVYQRGLCIVGGITILFASNSPILHALYSSTNADAVMPPVFLVNALVSCIAMVAVLGTGKVVSDDTVPVSLPKGSSAPPLPLRALLSNNSINMLPTQAGLELGFWKFLGTLSNIYGLSETSADHGAFLIQLTTLLVPLAQGLLGVPIPPRIWTAIALALSGVLLFTQDGNGATLQGDIACVLAAVFYATYDLRLFYWGKRVAALDLISNKIVTQTALSFFALILFTNNSLSFLTQASIEQLGLLFAAALWSGIAVNAVAPYLQVGGQQAIGPARAQILYASQPLWAALLSWGLLGETVGQQGMAGGMLFLVAMFLAATADVPDADCEKDICEV